MSEMASKKTLETCFKVYTMFEDMLDSYVSDYYIEDHWSKLPASWQEYFKDVDMKQFSNLLDFEAPLMLTSKLHPLSLLCLRVLIKNNVLRRTKLENKKPQTECDIPQFFWKNVKSKKKHEISIMAQTCYDSAVKTNCFNVVDVGSGLGHLSRLMSYQYDLNVCTFEANESLSSLAAHMDRKLEQMLEKRQITQGRKIKTVHLNEIVTADLGRCNFLKLVQDAFGLEDDVKFGLVGLHPCGDLGSTLLKIYKECPNIVFINMASCCYMKITVEPSAQATFPMSTVGEELDIKLSYLSCEIACHAIENYVDKLKCPERLTELKIHAYRAGVEKLLMGINPRLKHSKICSVKYNEKLSFHDYVSKVTENMGLSPSNKLISEIEKLVDRTWQNVVAFYSFRLFLAPLVETIILLDRLFYLSECGGDSDLLPLFDCSVSPRNQVLIARKINYR